VALAPVADRTQQRFTHRRRLSPSRSQSSLLGAAAKHSAPHHRTAVAFVSGQSAYRSSIELPVDDDYFEVATPLTEPRIQTVQNKITAVVLAYLFFLSLIFRVLYASAVVYITFSLYYVILNLVHTISSLSLVFVILCTRDCTRTDNGCT